MRCKRAWIAKPEKMRLRRQTAEHQFGTIKAWMGATHFLTKTLGRVSTEMSLHVLAYNLKRVMKILGIRALIEVIRRLRGRLGSLDEAIAAFHMWFAYCLSKRLA